jgi:hypothetical protein
MATSTFGSLIPMVHSTEPRPQSQASIGTCIIRAAIRVKVFAKDSNSQNNNRTDNKSSHISLHSEDGTLVGGGVLDVSFTIGVVLNGVKLFLNEVDVQVIRV